MSLRAPKAIPKTGLADRMRAWMKAQKRPFTKRDVYIGLGIDDPKLRATIRNAIPDFEHRGEIVKQPPDKRNRRQGVNRYHYSHEWHSPQKGSLKPRIFKGMYISGTFAVTDIVRLTDQNRDWIEKAVRKLVVDGHLEKVGRRLCAHGAGAETLYHVKNHDRFRLEVMR